MICISGVEYFAICSIAFIAGAAIALGINMFVSSKR